MASYFSYVPEFEYVSRFHHSKISQYINVKNLFKRGKIKSDIFEDLMFFEKYKIIGDDRPDNVAAQVYDDSSLDWVILLSNNITNIQSEWPLEHKSFQNFLFDKYGSEENLQGIHHYETTEVRNTKRTIIIPKGLEVPKDYSVEFWDERIGKSTTVSNITTPITNYVYELNIEDKKRNIFLLKPNFLNIVITDLEAAMSYKKGSTQYKSRTLVKGENIKLYS
tara:strand:+ start:17897 stop:18562 length:666 start_codon:yes stop_codon:yes gene_type:complete